MKPWYALLGLWLGIGGCSTAPPSLPAETITLATTTSTNDTGLLDALVPLFREQTGIEVKIVPKGTGQALELGRRGDADVLLVHAPEAEKQFMDEGFGETRLPVMYNDFVIVGPPNDPAGIKGNTLAVDAFTAIYKGGARFISRGDDSGTHKKELALWKGAGLRPSPDQHPWYKESGDGMAAILGIAHEQRAYTLSDRGTYLALRSKLELEVLSEGDPMLRNPYSVIVVNPAQHPGVKVEAARRFAEFLRAEATRKVIAEFGVEKYGRGLFVPEPLD